MDVRMPDGTIVSGVPEGITQSELLARYNKFTEANAVQQPSGIESIAPKRPSIFEDAAKREASKSEAWSGLGTGLADLAKMVTASTIGGTAAVPSGVEQGLKGIARQSMEGEPEMLMPAGVYQPGIDTEESLFGPETEQQRAQRKLGAQRVIAEVPEIPGAKTLANIGRQAQKKIESTVSPETRQAIEESQVTGNIFKGELDFGKNPSVRGYAMQAASVLGSIAPVVVTAIATKSPTAGGIVGGGMAADEAGQNAADFIGKMSDEQLAQTSPFYAQMLAGGAKPDEARALTIRKAAETGAALQGLVATFGDAFTGKLVTGAFDDILTKAAGKSALGKAAAGVGMSSLEQGLSETAEGVASDIGTKTVVPSKEVGEGSAQNFIMGLLGGVGPGAVSTLTGKPEEKPEEKPEAERAKYKRPESSNEAEAIARAKGFLTPEAPAVAPEVTPEAAPAAPAAPVAEDVNAPAMDREAMLKELEDQIAAAEAPVSKGKPESHYNKLQSTEAVSPAEEPVEAETPVEAAKPVPVKAPEIVSPAPTKAVTKAPVAPDDLSVKSHQYDTPDLRLKQADAFGTDLTTALYAEMESHGRAALKNRGLTNGYAVKQESLADAADAATLAFGTNDYNVFAPYAQIFPKVAKKLQAHLGTAPAAVAPAKPVAAAAPTNLNIAEKDLKGKFEGLFSASDYSNTEDGWFNPETNTLHMKGVDGTNVRHYAGDKTATGLSNITPITNAAEARAAVEAGKSFATVEEGSTAVKEAAPAEAPTAKGKKTAKPKTGLDRVAHLRKASWEKNPLMAFVADKGLHYVKGEKDNLMSEFNGGKQKLISGYGPVFKSTGLRIDALLPIAIQDGFLPQDATEDQLYSLIQQAFSGKRIDALYQEQGQEELAKKYAERMEQEEPPSEERTGQSDAEWYGMAEEEYVRMMATDLANTSDEDFAAIEAAIPEFNGVPPSTMTTRAAMEALGFTEQEIQDEENRIAAKAGETAPAKETTSAEPSAAPAELELQQQTEEELKAKQAEVDRLTKENERLTKAAEAKAKADAEREEFVLTGSDRAADVAAAQGQQDIFGVAEETPQEKFEKKKDELTQMAEKLLDKGTETYEDTEFEGNTYQVRTRTFTGKLFGSELRKVQDVIGLAKEITLVNTENQVMTLQLTGKNVGEGRNVRIMDSQYTNKEEAPAKEAETFTPLKDADGKPVVVYRGALGPEESAFAPTSFFGSGFFGKGINLTSSPEDASKYASTDAEVNIDLPGRASIMADALGIDYNEAKAELTKGGGKVYPLLVSMNNPLVVGKNKIQVSEPLLRLALAESNFQGTDADADRFVRQFNKAADGVEQFNVALNNKATTIYRQIASLQNKDGLIIQPELAPKGKGATHYLVFDKDQVKSVFEMAPAQPRAEKPVAKPAKEEKIVAEEVVGPAEKPAAPKLTREPVTIEGQFTEVGKEKQRLMITDQTKKLSDAQVSTLEKFYGFKRDTEDFANAVRQDVVNFITKGATYVNGKIRAIIRSMANGVLSVAVAFNPQFISQPYGVLVPEYTTKIEQVVERAPVEARKDMSAGAQRAYEVLYPALKGELVKNNKLFLITDKPTAMQFIFNPDGSLLFKSKVLLAKGVGDFEKGSNIIDANKITPAGVRTLVKRFNTTSTEGYDFNTVFGTMGVDEKTNGQYFSTVYHSVYTHLPDAAARLKALQEPGAENSRYSFGCINVDKETFGKLVKEHGEQMDGATLFVVPETGNDVMEFINGKATEAKDITRRKVEPVTKETKVETQRAKETAAAERTQVGKEEEGPIYNSIESSNVLGEEKKRSPSFKRKVAKLNRDHVNGKISAAQLANEVDWALKQAEDERLSKEPAKKERGYLEIVRRLAEATKRGDISKEAFDLATWFMRNNEALVDDLGVSIRGKGDAGVGGQYIKLARVMRLIKDGGSNLTVVHEILHHLERMMPVKVQQAIRTAWSKQLVNAQNRAKSPAEQLYFKLLMDGHYGQNNFGFVDVPNGEMSKVFMKAMAELDFNHPGSKSSFELAETLLKMGAVPISNYQYFNPSEFWAVNGSEIVKGRYDAVQGGVLSRLKNWLKELGQKIKSVFGLDSKTSIIRALDSLAKADGTFVTKDMLGEGEYKNVQKAPPTDYRNYRGEEMAPAEWDSPADSKLDTYIEYQFIDKHIDTKRVIENIKKVVGDISDKFNAYIKEELYHGRTAKGIHDFLQKELLPITKDMKEAGITIDELDEYLHNRHAEEYNEHINKINPNPKLQDRGSGISTEQARDYLEKLSPERKAIFEALAKQVDSIVKNTQDILVKAGIEDKSTIDAWRKKFPFYVPLKRDELEYVTKGGGVGAGLGTRGGVSKRATGSLKSVVDIFENIALQREQAVMKAEKARVGRALYGLAIQNPNPSFWLPINPDAIKNKAKLKQELEDLGLNPEDAENIAKEPVTSSIDKKTGMVKYAVNPLLRNSDNVFPIRINGKDRFIIFNSSDPRAKRMVESLKNLDAEQMGLAMGTIGEVTRFLASVNTQYNPVFGAWNFMRDVQGAALNLTTTEIAGHEKEVLKGVWPALKSIYSDLRAQRAGKEPTGEWQELFEQYQKAGGATGYKEQFSKGNDKPGIVERELKKLDRGNVRQAADAVFNWLSDYNDAMENAVRLSAFKVALDQGFSEDKAASIAKNLTVNFNRKGASSPTLQALYAFFNASVQGTKRLAETLKGPAGRKIVAGGMMIGVIQAIALAMAGYDDDEPPEFLKDKNLILPVPGGNYLIVPMPLGFNIFPGIGRLTTEYILGQAGLITGAKGLGDKTLSAASLILDSFNPLGSGSLLQIVSPTAFDPVAAITANKDAFGRPISKEDRSTAPTPGFQRSREGASWFSKNLAEFLNYVSSPAGTKYTQGAISPTADQIDYLIGQYTGGVGREVMKTGEYLKAVVKGETEELPSYRVPIVGKVYGETTTPAAISAKFYQNVTNLAKHENEIKQRIKNHDDIKEYRADHPEVRFINRANYLENQITQLNKQKKTLQEKGAPEARIKKIDEQKTQLMKGLNDQIKKLQQ